MPLPNSLDELGRSIEAGVSDATHTVKKSTTQTAQDLKNQADFVKALYAPTEQPDGQNEKQDTAPKSNAEKYGTLADQIPFIPNQRESEYKNSSGSLQDAVLPGLNDPGQTVSLGDQLTGQSDSKDLMKMAGVDPTKQMTADERAKLDATQKEQREKMSQHNREYVKFGTPLDPIGTLEEQVAKVRQQKKQEEEELKRQEEEEKKKKEEEEKQAQQELPEPSTKAKPGSPNISVNQAKTKTEIHRGSSG